MQTIYKDTTRVVYLEMRNGFNIKVHEDDWPPYCDVECDVEAALKWAEVSGLRASVERVVKTTVVDK